MKDSVNTRGLTRSHAVVLLFPAKVVYCSTTKEDRGIRSARSRINAVDCTGEAVGTCNVF